jgi:hypothetical protein
MPDLLIFRVCRGEAPGRRLMPLDVNVAVCLPTVTGNLNPEWFDSWVAWHRELGVQHVYFYVGGPEPSDMHPVGVSYDWINVGDWINQFETWLRAQVWSVHDCLFRAREQRVAWVMFMDVDELVHMPPGMTFNTLIHQLTNNKATGASFGSVPYLSTACHPNATSDMTKTHMIAWREPTAECQQWDGHPVVPEALCPTWQGRRKYFISTHATHKLHIHYPDIAPEHFVELSTDDDFWLKHARGAPWGQGVTCKNPGCKLQPNNTLVCLPSAVHCGSDCDPKLAAKLGAQLRRGAVLFTLDKSLIH